jgi:FAD/FMN-containing dehydrogenase
MDTKASRLLDAFTGLVGERYAVREADDMAPYLQEPRRLYNHPAALVLRPGSVGEIAAIIRLANETSTAIIPQGGNTGLVGGQVPRDKDLQIIVSVSRINRVRHLDAVGDHMIVDAGVTLAEARAGADSVDRLFPLSLPSEGSCQIGGNLSTNAGGTAVLAYGNMRDLVLGLEVVLPTGEIWEGLRTLRKDNTGYDLKQLFIGAEGSLGIITAAALKLFPKPRGAAVAFIGLASPAAALALLNKAREIAGSGLTSFELMPRFALEMVLRHAPGTRDPLAEPHPWYVLAEVSSGRSMADANTTMEAIFEGGFEDGHVADGVLADSLEQGSRLWQLRHVLSEVQRHEGGSIKHDVAVPVAAVPHLIEQATKAVTARIPGSRPVPFGHVGDGNIHFNISQPVGMDRGAFLDHWDEINEIVHAIVVDLGGTISAEHGIGQLKRGLLPGLKSPVEMDMMRRLKATFDPNNVLNPGKVL